MPGLFCYFLPVKTEQQAQTASATVSSFDFLSNWNAQDGFYLPPMAGRECQLLCRSFPTSYKDIAKLRGTQKFLCLNLLAAMLY